MFEGLKADGFDDCVVGVGRQFNNDVVVYDQDRIIKKLADDFTEGCEDAHDRDSECDHYSEAEEYFEFNIVGGYVGVNTPVYIRLGSLDELIQEE
jgi:hypothetical protein